MDNLNTRITTTDFIIPKISGDTNLAVSAEHKQPDNPAWAQVLLWDYSSKTVFF